jgi:uncharacterized membrane protein YjgN (DUF898 family)
MENQENSAFAFEGTWREFAPIAFTNLLLTIVTLGIYRFWATTRERRYLWGRTRFIDEQLEWTGTGKELFIGFLLVLVLFGVPFLFLQFGAQILILQGHAGLAGFLTFGAFGIIFYLVGLARFRALRYRLSRTYWHGIRGGSDDNGWRYAFSYIWKTLVGTLALWLMIPWSMMSLWNERWNAMSFGPYRFEAAGEHGPTMKRFLLFYLLPLLMFIAGMVVVSMGPALMDASNAFVIGVFAALSVLGFYFGLGLIALAFYAKFFRVAVEGLSLGKLDFNFAARTKDWLKLFLGDIGLVIVTLGIGYIFLSYRHWKFFITHLEAAGEIDLNALTQSTTRAPTQGEGLMDAFDVGAI